MAPANLPSDRRSKEIKANPYGTAQSRCMDQLVIGAATGATVGAAMSGIGGFFYARSLIKASEPWVMPVIKVVATGSITFGAFLGFGGLFRCDEYEGESDWDSLGFDGDRLGYEPKTAPPPIPATVILEVGPDSRAYLS